MSELLKNDLWNLIFVLVPGFMIIQGFEFGRHLKLKSINKDDILPYISLTAIYYIIILSFGYKLQTGASISTIPFQNLVITYLFVPSLLGVFCGIFVRFGFFYKIAKTLRIKIDEPAPPIRTPWPVIAPKITIGTYVMVILKDKTIYRALVTEDSQLSSDQDKIDLYLGQTFLGEEWVPSNPQRAVYIRGSEIQSIEIWKFEESTESTEP